MDPASPLPFTYEIHSFYWDNCADFAALQKQVFNHLGYDITQTCATGTRHAAWMDSVMQNTKSDVVLFVDIDAIPTMAETVSNDLMRAASGMLVGCHGAANHMNDKTGYIGPWWLAIRTDDWKRIGAPSALETETADVAQTYTIQARRHGMTVGGYDPAHVVIPMWDLPNKPKAYGIGTLYSNGCFHLFQSREHQYFKLFEAMCEQVLTP